MANLLLQALKRRRLVAKQCGVKVWCEGVVMEKRVLLVSEINFLLLLFLALNIEISTYKSDLKVNSIESNRCFIETPIKWSRNSRTSTTKKCKWIKSRPLYYHNSTASFNVTASAILICGDVHPHPGPVLDTSSSNPKPKRGFTAKCLKRSKPVQRNHEHLQCDKCYDLIHVRCVSSNASFHKTISVNQPGIWTCSSCILSELPFFKTRTRQMMLCVICIGIPTATSMLS